MPWCVEAIGGSARPAETKGATTTTRYVRCVSGRLAVGAAVGCRREVGDVAEGGFGDAVEDGFEVVEEDGVGGAFEDKGELGTSLATVLGQGMDGGTYSPKGINATLHRDERRNDHIRDEEHDGHEHA